MRTPPRPSTMRAPACTALLLALLTGLSGCGTCTSSGTSTGTGTEPGRPEGYRGCSVDDLPRLGTVVGSLDVAGAVEPSPVRLVPPDADGCPDSLVARTSDGVVGTSVRGLGLRPGTARVVRVGDAGRLLVLAGRTEQGSQAHVFGTGLREVAPDGRPLLPEVDRGRRVPVDASCDPGGGIAVVTAQAHEPPGIVLAWDVTRTTYDVRDGTAVRTGSEQVAQAVADPVLRRQRPELYDGRLLEDCERS